MKRGGEDKERKKNRQGKIWRKREITMERMRRRQKGTERKKKVEDRRGKMKTCNCDPGK